MLPATRLSTFDVPLGPLGFQGLRRNFVYHLRFYLCEGSVLYGARLTYK